MTSNDNGATPPSPTATSAAVSGCPVLARGDNADADPSSTMKPGIWNRWFSRTSNNESNSSIMNAAPVSSSMASGVSECPVKGMKSATPASIEEAANHSQTPARGQRIPLSTQRVISSIPRGDNDASYNNAPPVLSAANANDNLNSKTPSVPAHQPSNSSRWQYPSEQQFYNAMLKKGYRPPVQSIPSVLQIHNAVNERSWMQVRKWEKELHGNEDPKLVKFVGRPKDLSPKGWVNSRLFMTQEPFDRHDWYVEDNLVEGGEPRRYVIDFYEGKEKTGDLAPSLSNGESAGDNNNMPVMKPPSMYIDVRIALDNPSAAVDRMTMFAREALPGLTSVWDSYKTSPSPSSGITSVAQMEGSKSNAGSGKQ